MILQTLKKIGQNYLEQKITQSFRKEAIMKIRMAKWEIEDGNAWKASDLSYLAKLAAEQTKDQNFIQEIREKAKHTTFQGYKPQNSKNPTIKDLTEKIEHSKKEQNYITIQEQEIENLVREAEDETKQENYSEAANYYLQASRIAEKIGRPEQAKKLKYTLKNKTEEKK